MPRRKLTKLESLRVSKMFWELLMMQGEIIRWRYWEIPLDALQEMATRYNIGQLMDWVDSYARVLNVMRVFLKKITSYLRNGDLETPLDEWLQDPAESDKTQERFDISHGNFPQVDNITLGKLWIFGFKIYFQFVYI